MEKNYEKKKNSTQNQKKRVKYTQIFSKTTQKIKSLVQMKQKNLPESLINKRANPESNSNAARETFRSVRQEDIKR